MKTKPVIKSTPFQHLTPIQRTSRILAIIAAFIGVFVWFFIVLF